MPDGRQAIEQVGKKLSCQVTKLDATVIIGNSDFEDDTVLPLQINETGNLQENSAAVLKIAGLKTVPGV